MSKIDTALLFQTQSTLIVILMMIGIYFRKRREIHVKIMAITILWDITLILQIELSRGAIAKASQVAKNIMLLNIHVSLALLTVVFYGLMIYTGRKVLNGEKLVQQKHKSFGWVTFVLRILTYITSFFVVVPQ